MAKIVVKFTVKEGHTECNECPFHGHSCHDRFRDIDCVNYDLSTLETICSMEDSE